jgi:putative ABC transport system permease protein
VAAFVDHSFRSDYVVDSASDSQGFATTIENDIRALPRMATLSPERVAPAHVNGGDTPVIALDTAVIDRLYDLGVSTGAAEAVHGDGVAVAKTEARADDLHVGDRVPVRFADGQTMTMTIRAVFDGTSVGGDGNWIVGLDTFQAHVADQFDRRLFVKFDPGVPTATSRSALQSALRPWPNASVRDGAEFRASITAKIDALLNLVYGLLALALLIAVIGIANTLALSVHERRRELGLLRAIGMQRRQVRRAVRRESVITAILGTMLGLGLGIAGAWGIVKALSDQGVTQFVVPVGPLATITLLAALAGMVAAAGPARRAAKLDVLSAIASE